MPKSKYKAHKVYDPEYGWFDSKGEYARWQDLLLLQKAGVIVGLKRQVRYELIPAYVTAKGKKCRAVTYIADFRYYDSREGEWVTEDFKGYVTEVYRLKRKMMYYRYGIEIKETGRYS